MIRSLCLLGILITLGINTSCEKKSNAEKFVENASDKTEKSVEDGAEKTEKSSLRSKKMKKIFKQ